MKKCTKCSQIKDLDQFYKNNAEKDKLARYCKKCCLAYSRSNYAKRKEAKQKSQPRIRAATLLNTYGISIEKYDEMFNQQHGLCKICEKHQTEFKRRFAVDHDHVTGRIRGLLCYGCNIGLGFFKDSQDLLEKAKKYLK